MNKKTLLLLGFILLKFYLQFILISPEYDLHRDEYLHLDQAKHLAWGYQSVPPVTSWISFAISLLGNGVFWVKFFPALFGALTLLIVWKTIEALNGNIFSLTVGASGVLFSALLRFNTLYQPNSLDVLCWTTVFYLFINYLSTEKTKWLYWSAVVFAIGFLNKYNIAFLLLGLVPALLLTPQRKLFLKKELYLAALLGLMLILPNLIWQYQNNFPVLHHMNQLARLQLVHVDRFDFLKNQVLFFIGSVPIILLALYGLHFYKPFEQYKAFGWSLFFTLLVFLWFRAKDYYAIGLYPIYIAFGAVYLQHLSQTGWKKFLMPAAAIIPVLLFIPMYNIAFPNKTPEYILQHSNTYQKLGMLRWEDGKDHPLPQDFADMLGWRELALKVDQVYTEINQPENTLVLCDNYGQAGAINYYSRTGIRAVTFNADYIDWFELDKTYVNLIRVKERKDRNTEWRETSPYFMEAVIADSITNKFAREFGTVIFRFKGAKIDVNERIKAEIKEVKSYR